MARTERRPLALDTSVVVALVSGWHVHHRATVAALGKKLDQGHGLFVPAEALVEAYSVLTRLPPPHRVAPQIALELLRSNFDHGRASALAAASVWAALDEAVERGVSGGRVHDWVIARSASSAGRCILVTWNLGHFESFETETLLVRTPETLEAP